MAPGLLSDTHAESDNKIHDLKAQIREKPSQPLKYSGALDKFPFEESTPLIGREYPSIDIQKDLLEAENADDLLRDLAITISRRGVVFFRSQDNLTDGQQKVFVQKLGELTRKPTTSTLHVHPIHNGTSEFGVPDSEISVISSNERKRHIKVANKRQRHGAAIWHSDIQFEPYPADYTSLRLHTLPPTGGDTLWASGNELYDSYSKPYQKFFEGLTATFRGQAFLDAAKNYPDTVKIHPGPRGHPDNAGLDLTAVHPVVRTNPVTGWKSIYALGPFPKRINELNEDESDALLKSFTQKILDDHALTVRFRWRNKNDLAIWDNRSVFHSATNDYDDLGDRVGNRAVGIGERPYLDPNSLSREEALAQESS